MAKRKTTGLGVSPHSVRDALQVWLDAPLLQNAETGQLTQVGTLFHQNGVYSFAYAPSWLQGDQRFWLDPDLQLYAGEHYSSRTGNFRVFLDSAPDRWGRLLMERREQLAAREQGRSVRVLREWDFLLGLQDITRMGALRFCLPPAIGTTPAADNFLANESRAAPPITSLGELYAISQAVEADDLSQPVGAGQTGGGDTSHPSSLAWLTQLVAPGSSLGGARPKANFTHHDGSLWIVKFPSREDRRNVAAWEMLLHTLAQQVGIDVPTAQLLPLGQGYPSFAVQRFDRSQNAQGQTQRHLFVSAMTLLQAEDGQHQHSYLDLAQFISQHGAAGCVAQDLEQLFRRVVFNILCYNRDDHLRNHGFIRHPSGWRLSPAFDMNPNPEKYDHALPIAPNGAAPTMATALGTAAQYRLSSENAQGIVQQVTEGIRAWRQHAQRLGLSSAEAERMAAAFDASGVN